MALAMRGFILGALKLNSVQIPGCKSYQQKVITMLQTQHYGLTNSRKISCSPIMCADESIGTGDGPQINKTKSSEQRSVSTGSSSNTETTGMKSTGSEANATPKQAN